MMMELHPNDKKEYELEHAAMRGDPMPEKLCLVDQVYFQGLSSLYARFRSGSITRERGSMEKKMLLRERNRDLETYKWWDRCMMDSAKLWMRIEQAGHSFAKNQTIETAIAFYEAVYNIRIKKLEG